MALTSKGHSFPQERTGRDARRAVRLPRHRGGRGAHVELPAGLFRGPRQAQVPLRDALVHRLHRPQAGRRGGFIRGG